MIAARCRQPAGTHVGPGEPWVSRARSTPSRWPRSSAYRARPAHGGARGSRARTATARSTSRPGGSAPARRRDYSGPVEDRHALDVRLIDVCFHLMRFEGGSFEFVADEAPPWPADRATDIAPIVETVEHIVRAWPAVEAVLPNFDVRARAGRGAPRGVAHPEPDRLQDLHDDRRASAPSARSPGRSAAASWRSARC